MIFSVLHPLLDWHPPGWCMQACRIGARVLTLHIFWQIVLTFMCINSLSFKKRSTKTVALLLELARHCWYLWSGLNLKREQYLKSRDKWAEKHHQTRRKPEAGRKPEARLLWRRMLICHSNLQPIFVPLKALHCCYQSSCRMHNWVGPVNAKMQHRVFTWIPSLTLSNSAISQGRRNNCNIFENT